MKTLVLLFLFTAFINVYASIGTSGYFFMENKGQLRDRVGINHAEILFTGQAENYQIYLRENGWSYVLKSIDSNSYQTERVDIDFENYNQDCSFECKNQLTGYDNFPVRNNESINGVCSFGEVIYKNIYNGIDLRFYYECGNLRYDFIVHPGANPQQIQMKIKNSGKSVINEDFGINISAALGEIRKEKPFTYQLTENQKIEISSNYKLKDNLLSFETEIYDKSKDLIIDPVSLVYGKLRRMKSYFINDYSGINSRILDFYSIPLTFNNIRRLSDNSTILLTNNALDQVFIEENRSKIFELKTIEEFKTYYKIATPPTVLSKYSPNGDKEWSVYLYENHTNLISWDANDSLIVVLAQSYFYWDSISKTYTKDAVFISVYNMKGELLRRFEPDKPDGIEKFVHPQQNGNDWNYSRPLQNYPFDNLKSYIKWAFNFSYENTIKINNNRISLVTIGKYPGNDDTTYNYGLFLQTYNFNGTQNLNKELQHNKIYIRNNNINFDSSSFDYSGITGDIRMLKFFDDGSFNIVRIKKKNKDDNKAEIDAYFEYYDNAGNSIFKLPVSSDLRYLMEQSNKMNLALFLYNFTFPFKFDKDKNIYVIMHFNKNDITYNQLKKRIIKNPYTPEYTEFQPYLAKFDSTGKMLWATQILSLPNNFTIKSIDFDGKTAATIKNSQGQDTLFSAYDNALHYEGVNPITSVIFFSYQVPMNTGSELVIAFDSIGNIFIPRLIDTVEFKYQSSSRKLVIIKVSPDGKVLWQDTSALEFKFDYSEKSRLSSVMRIKNAHISGNELYIDYFVSNLQGMTPGKDAEKYELSEIFPIPDLNYLYGNMNVMETKDVTYDLMFLKFNINEKDLIPVGPDDVFFDTICVGGTSLKNITITNKWHSKMNFEAPLVEGEGFKINPAAAFSLAPNESKVFTVNFSPTQFKEYSGKVTFKQHDLEDIFQTVTLTGITNSTILAADSVWDIGTILVNNTASKTFRMYNKGNMNSGIYGFLNLPAEFKQVLPKQPSKYINAGDSLDFQFDFTPTSAGIFEYKYKFISTFGCPDTLEITLRGKGVTESIILNSDSIDYGYLYSCETKTDTITIENVTNNPVTYNSSELTGLNTDNFTILEKPTGGAILVRGEPAKFIIEYKPLSPYGIKTATLEISTSEKLLKCPLKGEYAEINVTANNIDMDFRNINVAYDTVITIKNKTRDLFSLKNAIPADSRVTVATSLPFDIPSLDERKLAIQIKSTVSNPLNTNIRLFFADKCTTEVATNIKVSFDSAKVEITGIDFGKVPYCEEKTDNIIIKNTGKSSVKIINIEFSENVGKFEFTKNEIYPVEIMGENSFTKSVKYLSAIKQKIKNTAKVKITLEIDGTEKTFEIEIKGERIIPELKYLPIFDFGQLKPDEIKNINFELKNLGEEFVITGVKTSNQNFSVISFPDLIKFNEKGLINLAFKSENIGEYTEGMTVYYRLGSCEDSLKIILQADVRRLMTIWANHDTLDAGTKNYPVPFYAKTDLNAHIGGTYYKLKIKYLNELFNNISSADAVITNISRDGIYETATVSGYFPEFTDSTKILFDLSGNVLFTQTKTTPIEIEFINSEASLLVSTFNGSLTLNPLCVDDLRTIQTFLPTSMQISPNPTDGDLKVSIGTQEEGKFSITIYDIQGREVARQEFSKADRNYITKEQSFNINNLGTGVYSVHLSTPWHILREHLVIAK